MVDGMKIGSVIMDLASEFGGNCELTKHGETVNFKSKKIIGPINLPASVAQDSSRLFSKNVLNLNIFPTRVLALVTSCLVLFVAVRMGIKLFI